MSDVRGAFLERLERVESRLAGLASTPVAAQARTDPDPGSGEQWDAGQVWAHLAEFVPFWVEEAHTVIAAHSDEAVPFGRTKTDASRLLAIERDRSVALAVLWSQTLSDIEMLRRFIQNLQPEAWSCRGLHATLGVMDLRRILDEFLVGHLEQHADQLSALAQAGADEAVT